MELRKIAAAVVASSAVLAGLAMAAGQSEVPRDWRRLKVPPVPGSREFACTGLTSTAWRVDFRDGMLKATLVILGERIQDQLPYEVDFSDAIDVQPPAPPPLSLEAGTPARTISERTEDAAVWARRYAREHARHHVVRVDDGWLVGFDAGEYGGSLWWYPAKKEPGPNCRP